MAPQFFTIMTDNPSERIYVVQASSKEEALSKVHKDLDLILREDYSTDEDFKAEVDLELEHNSRKLVVYPCTFKEDGVALIWER